MKIEVLRPFANFTSLEETNSTLNGLPTKPEQRTTAKPETKEHKLKRGQTKIPKPKNALTNKATFSGGGQRLFDVWCTDNAWKRRLIAWNPRGTKNSKLARSKQFSVNPSLQASRWLVVPYSLEIYTQAAHRDWLFLIGTILGYAPTVDRAGLLIVSENDELALAELQK
ncbi:hypothetical protein BDP27DRAFT_1376346 [Rhodocollybia butyracea]|uniref:Uncharacterized protein n=1 Tax=Rhodocollybia butyracea TaxID=206335 RepID=A0A9P5TVV1_9AGAR|nr:hypothetical protein BDP27DRAFT_1376346 [Rhodocollybia butyracea]